MSISGWIGVDLDGTLAYYDGWKGIEHIGEPVPAMMDRVRYWIENGTEVRIFTARVSSNDPDVVRYIHEWCRKHGLPELQVTCKKDFAMVQLYDDRCVQVEMNTGRLVAEEF